jgi:predicted membrane-bound mannosyltransferase
MGVLGVMALAAFLRIRGLDARPMHADEAVLADKFGTLLESGSWTYDPGDYHGPALPYLTLVSAWVAGQHRYVDLSESTLRAVSVAMGLALVAMPLLLVWGVGWGAALGAMALTAVSPGMVYYSRYYIPEMGLVLFSAVVMGAGYRYGATRRLIWIWSAGLALASMFLTKETAWIAVGCMGLGWWGERNWVFAGAMLPVMFERAWGLRGHVEPLTYYLGLLGRGEAPICALAIVGAVVGWRNGLVRFLAIYTASMLVVYSAIPYKTPWCLLGMLQGAILLAGVGVVRVARSRAGVIALGVASVVWLMLPGPYEYTPTLPDVLKVASRFGDPNVPIQVISRDNLWPLPWYLRRFPHVEWRREITDDMKPADAILVSSALEPALVHLLYEVPPPGERPLYVNLFDGDIRIRAGVMLRGYAKQTVVPDAPATYTDLLKR